MSRRPSSIEFEGFRAMLALAGIRQISQASLTVNATSNYSYTVVHAGCRRVVCMHLGSGADDIRFNMNATSTATKMPVIPQRYFVVDTEKGDALHYYNTSGGAIVVSLMEID